MKINYFLMVVAGIAIIMMVTFSMVVFAAKGPESGAGYEKKEPVIVEYINRNGWKTTFDEANMEVNESADGTYFVYTGDCAGTCYTHFAVIPGKQPNEVLSERTTGWSQDRMIRTEGFFQENKWCYTRMMNSAAGTVPVNQMFTAAEYNGGTFLIEVYQTNGNNEAMNMNVSDELSMVVDGLEFVNYMPQQEFMGTPGIYEIDYLENIDGTAVEVRDVIVLNSDHTGVMSLQDDQEFYWGSHLFYTNDAWTDAMEYTVEGDQLIVNFDGDWRTFTRVS